MPTSYRQILYHIVFRTESSGRTLPPDPAPCETLFRYIWGIIKNHDSHLHRINCMEDHVHILTDLHPSVALANFVRDIKASSSSWLRQNPDFPDFRGWADGYAALTYSWKDKDTISNYIANQREHHKTTSFMDEYRALMAEFGVKIDERYFP